MFFLILFFRWPFILSLGVIPIPYSEFYNLAISLSVEYSNTLRYRKNSNDGTLPFGSKAGHCFPPALSEGRAVHFRSTLTPWSRRGIFGGHCESLHYSGPDDILDTAVWFS